MFLRQDHWRLAHFLGFLCAVFMLGSAVYLQLYEFVFPCLYCVYIRLVTIVYGLTSLIAVIYRPKVWGRRVLGLLFSIYCLLGIGLSAYLIWLQEQPVDSVANCGQGIGASLIDWPFGETLVIMFAAYGDCVQADSWSIFGLSIPVLGLLGFIGLLVFEIGKRLMLTGERR
jgi:disulfide bond formation protein DsbB